MNLSKDSDDDDNEQIRPPDTVERVQMIDDNVNNTPTEEYLISQAILNSIQDFKKVQKEQDDYEDTILKQYAETRLERERMFKDLILALKKIATYDKNVADVLGLVENIVEGYCLAYMEYCELDNETTSKIFGELSKLRVNAKSVELLRCIIREERK